MTARWLSWAAAHPRLGRRRRGHHGLGGKRSGRVSLILLLPLVTLLAVGAVIQWMSRLPLWQCLVVGAVWGFAIVACDALSFWLHHRFGKTREERARSRFWE